MLEAEHLPHPENLPELLMENNAILHHVLNNQAYILEMITATYQLLKYHVYKDPRPDDAFVKEKSKLAMEKYKGYQENVSIIFERLQNRFEISTKKQNQNWNLKEFLEVFEGFLKNWQFFRRKTSQNWLKIALKNSLL